MRYTYALFFTLCFYPISAQDWSFGARAEYGFLFLHSQDVAPIGQSYPYGTGIDARYWMLSDKHRNNCHCYPNIGLSLQYHNYDNPEVLGFALPLVAYLEPWYRVYGSTYFLVRGTIGYSYLSKPYDPQTNPLNLSYSLPFSPFVAVGFGLGWSLNQHWRLHGLLQYNHVSNGGQREPNKGLNYPNFSLGVDYSLEPLTLKSAFDKSREAARNHLLLIDNFYAGKAIDATRVTYLVTGLSAIYSRQWANTSALFGGIEYIDNRAYAELIRQEGSNADFRQLGLLVGHEFRLGKFAFSQAAGIYLYKDYGNLPDWYQRYGLRWNFWRNFTLGTNIKVHGHIAEFLDARVGYQLPL